MRNAPDGAVCMCVCVWEGVGVSRRRGT